MILFIIITVQLLYVTATAFNGRLDLQQLSSEAVSGSYVHEDTGDGIHFSTDSNGKLHIQTLDGTPLLEIDESFSPSDPSHVNRIVRVIGTPILQHKSNNVYKEYHLTPSQVNLIRLNGMATLMSVKEREPSHHQREIEKAIASLMVHSHTRLIEKVARHLGEILELSGDKFPSLLPLYTTALAMEKTAKNKMTKKSKFPSDNSCLQYCKPCKEHECLGLCGDGCNCWKWVCGDCCYHKGCLNHDLDCRTCTGKSFELKCIVSAIDALAKCEADWQSEVIRTSCSEP
jgi:hypothetical protein